MKLTNLNGVLTKEVMDGRKSCFKYIFLKKISEGLLECHYFRFRIKIK